MAFELIILILLKEMQCIAFVWVKVTKRSSNNFAYVQIVLTCCKIRIQIRQKDH